MYFASFMTTIPKVRNVYESVYYHTWDARLDNILWALRGEEGVVTPFGTSTG